MSENPSFSKFKHLNDSERIIQAQKRLWIEYPTANKILKKLEGFLTYPTSNRMPNMLITGVSNNGKTSLLNRFRKKHDAYVDEETSQLIVPVLLIQAPPEPDEKRLYGAILKQLGAPIPSSEKAETRQARVVHLLDKTKTKILMIDEIHHILAGTMNKQRLFLNILRHLANDLKICLVCAGTREAHNAIRTDVQLENRFEPNRLQKWADNQELWNFLAILETSLPLQKKSEIYEAGLAEEILKMGGQLVGEMIKIVELATILAIETGEEKITRDLLYHIDYTPPNKRRNLNNKY